MYDRSVLDVDDALRLVDAVLSAAPGETTQPIAVAVVDDMGDWVAFARMDGVPSFNREYARRKAYTSSLMRRDLHEFAATQMQTGRLLTDLGDPQLIGSAHGGVVLRDVAGNVIGGLGVSGGTPEEDERLVRVALAVAPVLEQGGAA
jgi:uncharacterized protein GlcG (DUF336 family)